MIIQPFNKGSGHIIPVGEPALCSDPLQQGPAKVEGATVRLPFQRLSFQLGRVRDHREAVLSVEETSDGLVKRVIHLFLEKFSTQRSYTLQITETHASMKFNF